MDLFRLFKAFEQTEYTQVLPHFILAILGFVYLGKNWLTTKETTKEYLVYIPIILWGISFIYPFVYILLMDSANITNYRFGWVFPVISLIAYTAVKIWDSGSHKILMILAITTLIALMGRNTLFLNQYTSFAFESQNPYRLESEIIKIGNCIINDENERKFALVPRRVASQLRLYADIELLVGTYDTPNMSQDEWNKYIKLYDDYDRCDGDDLQKIEFANKFGATYIVWDGNGQEVNDKMNTFGYVELEKTGQYRVFAKR